MLKLYRSFSLLISLLSLLVGAPSVAHEGYGQRSLTASPATAPAQARATKPPEFQPGTAGVCRLYSLSGYLAVNAEGQIVPLQQYCQRQYNWVWYSNSKFWQAFRDIAASETMAYTQTLERERVEAYAQSVCPFLKDGGTLQELTQMQSDRQFPAEFDQTVIRAAIATDCPQYEHQYRSSSR